MNFQQRVSKKPGTDPFTAIPVGESVETDWASWEEALAASEPDLPSRHGESFSHSTM